MMGMALDSGGHLTHGFRPNVSGKLFRYSAYGVNPETWSRLPPFRPRFRIAVASGGTETPIADATLTPLGVLTDRRWTDVTVDLAPYAGTPVELVLRVTSPADVPPFDDRTGFGEPRVVP